MARQLRRWAPIAVLVLASIALTYPFLTQGLTDGDDRGAHLEYQHFFDQQISQGELYPRWMPGLNLGHGSPIFFVQYPTPYYVAWGLERIIPNHWGDFTETRALGLSVVLTLMLGALSAYAWCSAFVDRLSATLAALVFITLPYFFFIDLYHRLAVGEAWALALTPLALCCVERRPKRPNAWMAGLAVAFALVLCSHLFTAVLFFPILLAYAAFRAEPAQRVKALWQTAGALLLGIALAGVYSLPVFVHNRFLHPGGLLAFLGANYSPLSQMFPYDRAMFPQDTPGWHKLGQYSRYLAAAMLALVAYSLVAYFPVAHAGLRSRLKAILSLRALLAVFSFAMLGLTFLSGHLPGVGDVPGALPLKPYLVSQRAHIFMASFLTLELALGCYWLLRRQVFGALADFLLAMALVSYWMMTRWSLIAWQTIHPLWTMQFPWRFNVFLALAATGLAALAIADLGKRSLPKRMLSGVFIIALWGLTAGGIVSAAHVKDAFWGTQPVAYRPGRDAALPVYVQAKDMQEVRNVLRSPETSLEVSVTSGSGKAEVKMINPRLIDLHAACDSICTLQLGQFYYPAWRARLMPSDAAIALRASSPGGLMEISLPPGESNVAIELPRDWSEMLGPWVSLLSLIAVVVLAVSDNWRNQPRPS
jgi:hypothetical protein